MQDAFERLGFYVLGALLGAASGILLLPQLKMSSYAEGVMFSIFLGLLISAVVFEYRKVGALRANGMVRDEAIALITHEMRTSLNGTSWSIELILRKYGQVFQPQDRDMLQSILASIQVSVMHSVNLLDISLLDMDRLSIALEWKNLGDIEKIAQETVQRFELGAKHHGIQLESTIRLDAAREAEIDPMRFRIIMETLLENAIHYTSGDLKQIFVTAINDDVSINISVRDTGIGIPEEEQDEIFTKFYRASNARQSPVNGSGIGLTLCKQYVTAHHGTIRFESTLGKGTEFFVSIPLKTTARLNEFFETV